MAKSQPITPALHLTITCMVGKELSQFLRRYLRSAHRLLAPALSELSVALVGDKRMSDLHEQYMGIAGPTDVLTFPLDEDGRGRVTSGEVVVCVPEARRRAKLEGTQVRHEALLYALHGMLHLCGYDDQTPAAYKKMHQMEDHVLTQLGVGAVFAGKRIEPPRRAGKQAPQAPSVKATKTSNAKGLRRKA